MNIIVQNRRNVEFELADLEVQIKDFIEDNSIVVKLKHYYSNPYTTSVVLFDRGETIGLNMDFKKEILRLWQDA